MRTLATLATAAILLAACGDEKSSSPSSMSADAVRKALPRPETIQVGTPEASAQAALGAGGALRSGPSYQSPYAAVSYWTAVTLNVGVWATLTSVRLVTLFPPTSCGDDACTWGPALGDDGLNEWQLTVARAGDAYDWALSAWPAAGGGAVTLVAGHAVPGPDEWRSSGTFTIDLDASAALAHAEGWTQTDFGTIDVAYDSRTSLRIEAVLTGARSQDPADPCWMNAAYAFEATSGGGELQLGLENLDTSATLRLRTRWDETGAGRGDARFVRGSTEAQASQCWDGAPSYLMVYDGTAAEPGVEADCAFPTAAPPTIALP